MSVFVEWCLWCSERWKALDRGWQAVTLGLLFVLVVTWMPIHV